MRWRFWFVLILPWLVGCVQPVVTPTATAVLTPQKQSLEVEAPPAGATVASPLVIRGSTAVLPQGRQLTYRIFDSQGSMIANGTLPVAGPESGPGRFDSTISFTVAQTGPGRLELLDINASDLTIRSSANIPLILAGNGVLVATVITPKPGNPTITPVVVKPAITPTSTVPTATAQLPVAQAILIDSPAAGTQVGSPMTITGHTALLPPGGQLQYRVRDTAGNPIGQGTIAVQAAENGGIFNASLTFVEPAAGGAISIEVTQPNVTTAVLVVQVAPPQTITFDSPAPGTLVGSPMTITGRLGRYPYQGNLSYRVYDASGQIIGEGVIQVDGEPGNPANFTAEVNFNAPASGDVRIELTDEDADSGRVAARQSLNVRVGSAAPITPSIPTITPNLPTPPAATNTPAATAYPAP